VSEIKFRPVFLFLDTDKHASPFDILMTIDLVPDVVVLKYENISPEDVEKVVYDALFPRGPKGVKYTKIFVNGSKLETVNAVVEKIKKCMFPPFELSVIVDPRGSYTTASAAVVKTLEVMQKLGLGTIEGKNVTILAGTGPVGVVATWLYTAERAAKVTVTSRELARAQNLASRVNEELKTDVVKPFQVRTPEDVGRAIEDADIVLATGAPGVQLLPLNILKAHGRKVKVVADCNAVPPYGVEGLEPKWDGKEVVPGVYGVGALAIGTLKNKIEAELIKKALQEPKGIFDFRAAYEIGKALLPPKR
jgi:methylene-tetrahydromethanopterin dehydrogenase